MVKKFIILGEINKKHLLPLCVVIYQISYKIFNKYYPEKIINNVFNMYSTSLGMMSILFLKCIFKLKTKEEQKEKKIHKRKWLHYLLLIIIFYAYTIMKSIIIGLKASKIKSSSGNNESGNTQVVNPFAEGPFINIGIEMLFLTVASIILLKYKYFIHHYISIAGFILFGNFSDILLKYYPQIIDYGAVINIVQILSIIVDVIYYYYQKYMMEKLFYHYWRIGFTFGVSLLLFPTIVLIYVLVEKGNSDPIIINGKDFYSYFRNEDVGLKFGKQILTYIFAFVSNALYILNIYHFSPNYILISFQFSKFVDVLINEHEDKNKYYCIIFFIFQLFFLTIYLEILELNFCKLNKNTKKNIELRSILDSSGQKGRYLSTDLENIDINDDYYIVSSDKNIELCPQIVSEDMH